MEQADARYTCMAQAHANHAASRHNAITTSRTSTGARRNPMAAGGSHHFPASKARAASSRLTVTANLAGRTKHENGLAQNGPFPAHTHASQHTTHEASMGRAEAPRRRTLDFWSANPLIRRFRHAEETMPRRLHMHARGPHVHFTANRALTVMVI